MSNTFRLYSKSLEVRLPIECDDDEVNEEIYRIIDGIVDARLQELGETIKRKLDEESLASTSLVHVNIYV